MQKRIDRGSGAWIINPEGHRQVLSWHVTSKLTDNNDE
jgi:hypothetical protein